MSDASAPTLPEAPERGDLHGTPIPDRPVAVAVRDVHKQFVIPHDRVMTLKERITSRGRKPSMLNVLDGVDFDIREGEFFGIVGRNGSGKSTLLKCMAGIYAPEAGSIGIRGKMATFIELGVGFNPSLSARDNVVLNATLLGLSSQEALARFDEIIAFAELEDFVDLQLRNYSSGMHVRLAFSVAIHVDADVLLIDEVLAVGDLAFQQKCFDTFDRYRREGRTVVFVTHDMALVERFCTRALMLEGGQIVAFGDPPHVAVEYMRVNYDQLGDAPASGDRVTRVGDGAAEIRDAWVEDDSGLRLTRVPQGTTAHLKVRVRFVREMDNPLLGVTIKDHEKRAVFMTNTLLDRVETGHFEPGDEAILAVEFENLLEDGRYIISPSVVYADGNRVADLRPEVTSVLVTGRRRAEGRVNLKHETGIERA